MKRRQVLFASLLAMFTPAASKATETSVPLAVPGTRTRAEFETNIRNVSHHELFETIIREGLGDIKQIGTGHHIMYWQEGNALPNEFPCADCVIFDHTIAKKIWGERWQEALTRLALAPPENREQVLGEMYYGRDKP